MKEYYSMSMPNDSNKTKPNRIKLIKDYQKIAAGEVVERPASVVKELVENSIDAGSTNITIIIKNFGKELIQVIDNGFGIGSDDVKIAFEAHTSSKINSAEDLNSLEFLGFRGEALYSISSISRIELVTKTSKTSDEMGIKLIIEGGKTKSLESIGTTVGTNIKVRDIFYNTPVRYKFLKTDRVEMGHITDIITRFILAYPGIHFKLIHGDLPIINSPSTKKRINAVFDIYGKSITKNLAEFAYDDPLFKINGFLGDPSLSRSTPLSSSVFVNNRYVKSPMINNAMNDAYKGYLMVKKYPFFIVFLEIEPNKIDVNIHPTKKVIRFEKEESLMKRLIFILRGIVEEKFGRKKGIIIADSQKSKINSVLIADLFPSSGTSKQNKGAKVEIMDNDRKINAQSIKNVKYGKKNGKRTSPLILNKMYDIYDNISDKEDKETFKSNTKFGEKGYTGGKRWIITNGIFPDMKLINEAGQLNKTYIVLEGENGFFLLDQHAAAERIKYEEQIESFKKGSLQRQQLLSPIKFDVSINEVDFFKEVLPQLPKFGFEINSLGGTTFAIRSIPAVLKKVTDPAIIKDICLEITAFGKQSSLKDEFDKIIKYIACHKSLRGGEKINDPNKVRELMYRLSKCRNPHHCAHGRPTILFFDWKEIEKMFHRIQ
ncbi:MAG: DNA mismatch repair endonuclease MutL [Promethearchaeota archaeon]